MVYEHLKPHERKELLRLLLRSVEVGERQIVLESYASYAADGRKPGSSTTARAIGVAPRRGFEPRTYRLTAGCSTVELSGNGC